MSKMTDVKLEKISDIVLIYCKNTLFTEKGLRGGISYIAL